MTDKQPEALRLADELEEPLHDFPEATELESNAAAELRRLHAELETLRAKLKTHEDLGDAADDVQLLRMGYAAARLEIESLKEQLAGRASHGQASAPLILNCKSEQKRLATLWGFVPAQPAPATLAVNDDLRDRLVSISEAIAYQDDRAAQAMLREILAATQPTAQQAPAQAAPAAVAGPADTFRGDTTCLVQNIVALLELDADGALVPHGIGGHARALLSAAASRLAAPTTQPAPQQEAQEPVKLSDEQLKAHGDKASRMMARDLTRFDAACEVNKYLREQGTPYYYMHRMCIVLFGNDEGTEAARAADTDPQPSPAAQGDALDAARWHWIAEYLVGPRTDLDDEIVASETVNELRKLVDAARAAQEGK